MDATTQKALDLIAKLLGAETPAAAPVRPAPARRDVPAFEIPGLVITLPSRVLRS
ncbi:hypothetical protein ACRAVF_34025 (plasmid) [Bradyrhizobium oligotrophicum S58]